VIWLSLISLCLIVNNCAYHQPELYPISDVLVPSEEVQIIEITEEGNILVNQAFILWVESLKQEIVRLRKEIEKLKGGW